MRLATVATCSLNQWALDFDGNTRRIIESIAAAKAAGASYRVGPELEVTGYGCEDHFLESDTCEHAWECLAAIISSGVTAGILCDIGLPVEHCGARYNARVFVCGARVLLVRPKLDLANDGNYREPRWFAAWRRQRGMECLALPECVAQACGGQQEAPIGNGIVQLPDASVACETCEELFTPAAPHILLALAGVDIVANGSGSHHELRKLSTRIRLICSATAKAGGVYLYANQRGCDGGRLYYDGCPLVVVNGSVVAQGPQFALADVQVVTATVDLDQVRSYRGAISSFREQSAALPSSADPFSPSPAPSLFPFPARIPCSFRLCSPSQLLLRPAKPIKVRVPLPEQEIAFGPACWLWDYLRRSGAAGFLLPLSGGADSSSVAAIVGTMCQLAAAAAALGDQQVQADVQRLTGQRLPSPASLRALLPALPAEPQSASSSAAAAPGAALEGREQADGPLSAADAEAGGTAAETGAARAALWLEDLVLAGEGPGGGQGRGSPGGTGGAQAAEAEVGRVGEPGVGPGEERADQWLVVQAEAIARKGQTGAGGEGAGEEEGALLAGRVAAEVKGQLRRQAQWLAGCLLFTMYMGTENSSSATRLRARQLAAEVGSSHLSFAIDAVVTALVALFTAVTGLRPQFKVDGGSSAENLALQNIQARLRMVLAFLFAQLLPWVRGVTGGRVAAAPAGGDAGHAAAESAAGGEDSGGGHPLPPGTGGVAGPAGNEGEAGSRKWAGPRGGFLLVLGSANVDEALRGYLTKYDCSSADINPIGGVSKTDLRRFLRWAARHLGYASLADVEAAPPTAELEPIRSDYTQLDEADMGMTYAELSLFGRLRKIMRCGPVSMFLYLCHEWGSLLHPAQVAEKVKHFFRCYSSNRHKMTTLTPSYHAEVRVKRR